ncbi:hypothetical protein [Horticoccus sp. 23ND18S-11]|uniref:hypothetical protein n=1 Tax=Horticoccus sp. 23ND18S-11 TaxID=3391832 RepID=UPI0039C8C0E0
MKNSRTPDPLSTLLARWQVVAPRDPGFRAGVWARLGGTAPATWSAYARRHAAAVGGILMVAVAVGAFTGREQARSRSAQESARLAAAYVQGLDARSMPTP